MTGSDRSFGASLLRAVAGGLGLVALVAVLFAAIGMVGRADRPASEDGQDTDDLAGGADEVGGDGAADDADGADDERPSTDETAPDGPDADGLDDPADPSQDADDRDDNFGQPQDDEGRIAPEEVTVQVLDGYRDDGGSAAAAVASQLREEGYPVVAENPAISYEVTTVLWTSGFEAEARQVAAEIDAAEVREQPGNLSTQVHVHVVVGADHG